MASGEQASGRETCPRLSAMEPSPGAIQSPKTRTRRKPGQSRSPSPMPAVSRLTVTQGSGRRCTAATSYDGLDWSSMFGQGSLEVPSSEPQPPVSPPPPRVRSTVVFDEHPTGGSDRSPSPISQRREPPVSSDFMSRISGPGALCAAAPPAELKAEISETSGRVAGLVGRLLVFKQQMAADSSALGALAEVASSSSCLSSSSSSSSSTSSASSGCADSLLTTDASLTSKAQMESFQSEESEIASPPTVVQSEAEVRCSPTSGPPATQSFQSGTDYVGASRTTQPIRLTMPSLDQMYDGIDWTLLQTDSGGVLHRPALGRPADLLCRHTSTEGSANFQMTPRKSETAESTPPPPAQEASAERPSGRLTSVRFAEDDGLQASSADAAEAKPNVALLRPLTSDPELYLEERSSSSEMRRQSQESASGAPMVYGAPIAEQAFQPCAGACVADDESVLSRQLDPDLQFEQSPQRRTSVRMYTLGAQPLDLDLASKEPRRTSVRPCSQVRVSTPSPSFGQAEGDSSSPHTSIGDLSSPYTQRRELLEAGKGTRSSTSQAVVLELVVAPNDHASPDAAQLEANSPTPTLGRSDEPAAGAVRVSETISDVMLRSLSVQSEASSISYLADKDERLRLPLAVGPGPSEALGSVGTFVDSSAYPASVRGARPPVLADRLSEDCRAGWPGIIPSDVAEMLSQRHALMELESSLEEEESRRQQEAEQVVQLRRGMDQLHQEMAARSSVFPEQEVQRAAIDELRRENSEFASCLQEEQRMQRELIARNSMLEIESLELREKSARVTKIDGDRIVLAQSLEEEVRKTARWEEHAAACERNTEKLARQLVAKHNAHQDALAAADAARSLGSELLVQEASLAAQLGVERRRSCQFEKQTASCQSALDALSRQRAAGDNFSRELLAEHAVVSNLRLECSHLEGHVAAEGQRCGTIEASAAQHLSELDAERAMVAELRQERANVTSRLQTEVRSGRKMEEQVSALRVEMEQLSHEASAGNIASTELRVEHAVASELRAEREALTEQLALVGRANVQAEERAVKYKERSDLLSQCSESELAALADLQAERRLVAELQAEREVLVERLDEEERRSAHAGQEARGLLACRTEVDTLLTQLATERTKLVELRRGQPPAHPSPAACSPPPALLQPQQSQKPLQSKQPQLLQLQLQQQAVAPSLSRAAATVAQPEEKRRQTPAARSETACPAKKAAPALDSDKYGVFLGQLAAERDRADQAEAVAAALEKRFAATVEAAKSQVDAYQEDCLVLQQQLQSERAGRLAEEKRVAFLQQQILVESQRREDVDLKVVDLEKRLATIEIEALQSAERSVEQYVRHQTKDLTDEFHLLHERLAAREARIQMQGFELPEREFQSQIEATVNDQDQCRLQVFQNGSSEAFHGKSIGRRAGCEAVALATRPMRERKAVPTTEVVPSKPQTDTSKVSEGPHLTWLEKVKSFRARLASADRASEFGLSHTIEHRKRLIIHAMSVDKPM